MNPSDTLASTPPTIDAGRAATPALGPARAPVRFGRAGAIYDLVIMVAFATPWTAAIMLDLQRWLHTALGAAGAPLPEFGPAQMLFVNMAGTAVTMWAIGPPPVDGFVNERLADLDRRVEDLVRVRAALVSLADAPPQPGECPVIDALGGSDQAAEELLG